MNTFIDAFFKCKVSFLFYQKTIGSHYITVIDCNGNKQIFLT